MENYKKYKERNNLFFDNLLAQTGDDHTSVGWSKTSHQKRMKKIMEIGDLENKKLLDIGCGVGSFLSFCNFNNINIDYHGFDVNEKMLKAARTRFPSLAGRFRKIDIIEEESDEVFDFCISIGSLNLNLDARTNYSMTFKMLDCMFKYSKLGIAFSMTSSFSKRKNTNTFYYDPNKIIKHISKYCNNFKLDHSYLPHDFVIFCYKNDFYSNE